MRIVDGLINDPKLIFGGWIFSIIIIFLHVGKKEEFDIHEFSLNASLGAYVLVIQMLLFRVIPP
ncbi:MAG: hypothetical protein OEY49_11450, partial [Candidatus Heimdallarchaeota archaeon]|nr:hypothetical protein [Candidatus Heimdallarchaeota archaeon]